MSLALAAPSRLSPALSHGTAISPVASELFGMLSRAFAADSSVVVEGPENVMERLLDAIAKGAEDGIPVTPEAYERAFCVLSSIPPRFSKPEIVIEPDGEIGLDWDRGRRRLLSVSVGDSPMLGYAAMIGPETAHGRVVFSGALPSVLALLLRRI